MKPGLAFAQRRPSTFCDKPGHHRVEAAELRKPFRQRPVHVQSVYRSLDVHWSQMSDVPRNINLFPLNAARSKLDANAGRVLRRLAEQGAEVPIYAPRALSAGPESIPRGSMGSGPPGFDGICPAGFDHLGMFKGMARHAPA